MNVWPFINSIRVYGRSYWIVFYLKNKRNKYCLKNFLTLQKKLKLFIYIWYFFSSKVTVLLNSVLNFPYIYVYVHIYVDTRGCQKNGDLNRDTENRPKRRRIPQGGRSKVVVPNLSRLLFRRWDSLKEDGKGGTDRQRGLIMTRDRVGQVVTRLNLSYHCTGKVDNSNKLNLSPIYDIVWYLRFSKINLL